MTTPTSTLRFLYLTVIALAALWLAAAAATPLHAKTVHLAVVQGGDYAGHQELSHGVLVEVRRLLPDSIEVVTPPEAYVNGGWRIDEFREQVASLVASDPADIALALGPWSVEELLDAGWEKPIVAAFRFDPMAEGLLDSTMYPVAPNLCVTAFPNRYANDLLDLKRLLSVDTLAVLKFESSPGDSIVPERVLRVAEQLGITLMPVRGFTPRGEYAFFKAYQHIPESADALYLSPLWGLQADAIKQYLAMAARDRRPVFASGGAYLVERGALASGAGRTWETEAVIVAWKLARIIAGESPSDLPVAYPESRGLTVNEATAEKCGIAISDRVRGEAIVFSETPAGDQYDFSLALSTALSRRGKAPEDSVESAVTSGYLRFLLSSFAVEVQRAAVVVLDGLYERAYGAALVDLIDQRELKRLRVERLTLETGMYAALRERTEAGAGFARALSFAADYPLHVDTTVYSERELMSTYHQMSDSLSSPAVRERILEELMAEERSASHNRGDDETIRLKLYTRLLRISEKLQAASSLFEAHHEAQNVLMMLTEQPSGLAEEAIEAVELVRGTRLAMVTNRLAFFRECAGLASEMGWKSEGNWKAPVEQLLRVVQSGSEGKSGK